MIEYICVECKHSEMVAEIVPKAICPKCGRMLEVIEPEEVE